MDTIDIIKTAHGVDHDLGRLAASLEDEELRERILAVQSTWRELAYAISGTVCGVAMTRLEEPMKRRGRRRKSEQSGPAVDPGHGDSGRAASASTSSAESQT